MALPTVLLKAKSAIKKGAEAYKAGKQAKSLIDSTNDGDKVLSFISKPIKYLLAVGGSIFAFILIVFIMVVSFPDALLSGFAAADTGNSSTMAPSDWDDFYFNQYEGEWANVVYDASGGTIAQAGCGLCSITHVIDLLTGNDYQPQEISEQLKEYYNGNVSIYAPGGSVVGKLVEFAVGKYGLTSNHYDNIDDALRDMSSGQKVLICSDNGDGSHFVRPDGGTYSANHVIMCYKTDGENCWVKDSGISGGNSVKYTKEQLSQIDFVGFYVIGTA